MVTAVLKRFANLLQTSPLLAARKGAASSQPADLGPLRRNRILARWPSAALQRTLPFLELVALAPGQRLHWPEEDGNHIYFPINATISLGCQVEADVCAEFLQVGCEGLVGMEAFLSGESTPWEASVRTPGYAYRVAAEVLQREFDRSEAVRCVMLYYTASLLAQLAADGGQRAALRAVETALV